MTTRTLTGTSTQENPDTNGGHRGIVDRYGNQGGGGNRPPGYRPNPPRGGQPQGGRPQGGRPQGGRPQGGRPQDGARQRVTPEGYRPPVRPERDPGERRQSQDRRNDERGRRPASRGRRRRWRPRRVIGLVVLVLVLLVVGFGVYIDTSLNREEAITEYAGKPSAGEGTNWLIVGSDSREGMDPEEAAKLHTGTDQDAGGKRTDSMMLLHLPSNGTKPTLVSLMRDSQVKVPGHGTTKLNSAYAYGGSKLLAQTVEQNTGVRLDHYMEIGFGGFAGIVDDVGGVNICVKQRMKDEYAGINLQKGCQDLEGKQALGFVRARHFAASSDYARTENQRQFMGALADQMSSPATFLNPFRLFPLLSDLPDALTVDNSDHVWNLVGCAWDLRGISSGGVNTTIVPVSGSGSGGSVVWSKSKSNQLFEALRTDQEVPQDLIQTDAGGS